MMILKKTIQVNETTTERWYRDGTRWASHLCVKVAGSSFLCMGEIIVRDLSTGAEKRFDSTMGNSDCAAYIDSMWNKHLG